MPITADSYLPTTEELTVEELNISGPALRGAAVYLGKYCDEPAKEFMLCTEEEKDPRKCFRESKVVTACALEFFRKVKKSCRDPFENYWKCLMHNSADMHPRHCRKTQAVLDQCMLEQLQIERPELGYFCKVRIHHTERPKPVEEPPIVYPEVPGLPPDAPLPPAKHGSRFFFYP